MDENKYSSEEVKITGIKAKDELLTYMESIIPSNLTNNDLVFVCIGTDRSTGDSLGPLVGSYLEELGYTNVIGTLDAPTHAVNLAERIESLPQDKTVIAIDASLGSLSRVGTFTFKNSPLKPGAGVGKELPEVGDYSIAGIVNIGGYMEYYVLQNTRLSVVVRMAKDITYAITELFPLQQVNIKLIEGELMMFEQQLAASE